MKHRAFSILLSILLLTTLLGSCGPSPHTQHDAQKEEVLPTLTIGSSSYNPYFYVDEDGFYAGIDKEIAQEACNRMNYKVVFKELSWGEQVRKLKNGSIDCIWGGFAMNGREDEYQWAGPYLLSPIVACVRADSNISTLNDLQSKKVSVLVNSRAESYFLNQSGTSRLQVYTYNSLELAFASFAKGYTDAVVGHQTGLNQYTQEDPSLYRYLNPPVHIAHLGVAFPKNADPDFVNQLSQTLDEMNEDGTIPAIAKKYGLTTSNLLEVTSDEDKKK